MNVLCRKLPKPSTTLIPSQPTVNPLLHQGRKRSTPHVEGQFASYVYISVHVDARLQQFLEAATRFSKERVPTLQSEWLECSTSSSPSLPIRELHISLTRPIYVFHHQREDFKRAVKLLAHYASQCVSPLWSFCPWTDYSNRGFTKVLYIICIICVVY